MGTYNHALYTVGEHFNLCSKIFSSHISISKGGRGYVEVPWAPTLHPEQFTSNLILLSKNFFGQKKPIFAHTVQGTAMVPLTTPFHLCDLQKKDIEENFFGPKNENMRIRFRAQR